MTPVHTITSSGALIRRFLPYLAKYKKVLFIDLFCAALTTMCDIILPKIDRAPLPTPPWVWASR